MVDRYVNTLFKIAKIDNQVLAIGVDDGIFPDMFKGEMRKQYINVGIAECNAVGLAAGLSSTGKVPFVTGGGSFMAYRAFEFIRNDLCMQDRNVKVVGIGAGLAISVLGVTQHATEDISALRTLPGLMIFSPATVTEIEYVVQSAYQIQGPVYIRIGRSCGEDFYERGLKFSAGKALEILSGKDVTIISTGSITSDMLVVAELLKTEGIDAGVVHIHTLKPFDGEFLKSLIRKTNKVVTVEEHSIYGGLGSIVAEYLAESKDNAVLKRIGLENKFAVGHGTYEDIKRINGLSTEIVREKISEFIRKE